MKTQSILVLAIIDLLLVSHLAFAGEIVGWGYNSNGQASPPSGDDYMAIAAGEEHSLALKSNGSLTGWGMNTSGQTNVPTGNDFTAIAAGVSHSITLRTDGSLTAWGNNVDGKTDVPPGNEFVDIASGVYHSLAIKADGSLVGWGFNAFGQTNVPSGNDFIAIAGGNSHSLALRSDGSLIGWGENHNGVLSNIPEGNDFVTIAGSYYHYLALKSDGSLVAWGWNIFGQTDVPEGNEFVAIAAGGYHSLALRSDGSIAAWGYNRYRQTDVPTGNNFVAIAAGVHHSLALTPEPAAPPIANADGPYSIFVGDTLTLDASGSTDVDDDIVSYMWDLDDDESFETDAGGQAVFDVNYAYLQSLGLLVDNTYNIHVQVTDSEGQSDVNDTTLTILPKPAVVVAVDIKPGSCPNPVNVKSSGVLPIAILGTDDVNVITIDPTSIRLAGVEPLRSSFEDVASPLWDTNDCNCITEGPDGFLDLTLKFKTQRIVEAIGDVNDGDVRVLTLTGVLFDPIPFERPIEGADCILIRGKHKPFNKADINKDGVVDSADFAILAENWLQSSTVDD